MTGGYLEGEPPICEPCAKPILRGQFIYRYDDIGAAHVDCKAPNATTDPSVVDEDAGPVYVLLGSPLMLYGVVDLSRMTTPPIPGSRSTSEGEEE